MDVQPLSVTSTPRKPHSKSHSPFPTPSGLYLHRLKGKGKAESPFTPPEPPRSTVAVFPAAHFLHFCSISSRSQTFPFGAKRPFVSKPFAGIWGLHSQRGGEQSAGRPECGVCAVQTQGFTRMPKFGAKEDSGKRTSPPLPTPPASIATFCTIPTFPKAKRRAGSGPPPPALFGEKTPLFGLSATVAAKGGEGAAQPRPHKAPGTGAAPRMEEGRSRRTCAAAHRPAPLPAPSRGAPTRGVCAHTGGGDRSAHVCTRPDGCTRSCPRFHLRSRTRCAHPPLPRAHPARAPPAASPPPPPRAPAPRTPPPGPPLGHAPPERRAPLRPRPLSRSTNGRRLVPCRARPPRCLLSRSNAPAAAARHRSAAPRRSDAPGATWRAAARCAGPAGGARRGRGRKGVMQRGAGGARDEGAWKNPNAPPGWGGMGRAAPPEWS